MRRPFLLFGWDSQDANGGWNDFIGAYSAISSAKRAGERFATKEGLSWLRRWHIVDLRIGKVIVLKPDEEYSPTPGAYDEFYMDL